MESAVCGIILAGGMSRRMGADKALLELDGETLLERVIRTVSEIAPKIVIVGRTAVPSSLTRIPALADDYPGSGPLGGIVTGLERSQAEFGLVVACDLPFVRAHLLRCLVDLMPGYDAVVPRSPVPGDTDRHRQTTAAARHSLAGRAVHAHAYVEMGMPETPFGEAQHRPHPTCAVYARSCLPALHAALRASRYRLTDVLSTLTVRWLEDDELRAVDPGGRSLLNVNTPDDWRHAGGEFAP